MVEEVLVQLVVLLVLDQERLLPQRALVLLMLAALAVKQLVAAQETRATEEI